MEKQNFYDFNFDHLKSFLVEEIGIDEKKAKMRSQQLFNAVYKQNIKSFDELSTLGVDLKKKINESLTLEKPKIIVIDVFNIATPTVE